jgi:hypothetical protein
MDKLKFNEDVLFEKNPLDELIERIAVQRAKHMDDAILGEINEIIKENEHLTVVNLNEKAIVEALEKQIPKKAIDDGTQFAICPECGASVNKDIEQVYNGETSYCICCGQALDWSDTE